MATKPFSTNWLDRAESRLSARNLSPLHSVTDAMRYTCLLALTLSVLSPRLLFAHDGGAIYKERCASCHDMPEGRTPPLSTIKGMTGEAIYTALATGSMKTQAQGLEGPQLFALI